MRQKVSQVFKHLLLFSIFIEMLLAILDHTFNLLHEDVLEWSLRLHLLLLLLLLLLDRNSQSRYRLRVLLLRLHHQTLRGRVNARFMLIGQVGVLGGDYLVNSTTAPCSDFIWRRNAYVSTDLQNGGCRLLQCFTHTT